MTRERDTRLPCSAASKWTTWPQNHNSSSKDAQ